MSSGDFVAFVAVFAAASVLAAWAKAVVANASRNNGITANRIHFMEHLPDGPNPYGRV
jgi:hypothetical protein